MFIFLPLRAIEPLKAIRGIAGCFAAPIAILRGF
jgi:hypothetical protein